MAGVTSADAYGHRTGASSAIGTVNDSQGPHRVVAVCDEPMTLGSLLWAGALGLASSGLLVVMTFPGLDLSRLAWSTDLLTVGALWLPAWFLFTWALAQCTGDLLQVSRRAFAVGALECLALGLWFRVDGLAGAASQGVSITAQSASGLAEQLAGTPATVGLWVCLLGWMACKALAAPRQPVRVRASRTQQSAAG